MKIQKFHPDNRHKLYYTHTPVISTSQSYRGNLMGHTHSIPVRQDFNRDRRYYMPSDHRGYKKQREYIGRNEQYMHSNYVRAHNNNLTMRKPATNPHYYYKLPAESDQYHLPVSHYYSEPSLTDVTSSHASEISYTESLVSVASSFDDLYHRVGTHNRKEQQHHRHAYPYSDTEDRHEHHVYSLYSSDEQITGYSDVERDTHQQKDTRLHRRGDTFSASRTKDNTNNNQTLSYSIYNTKINSGNSGKNNIPLIMFRKDENEDSSNSDVVYIPVVILPEKNTSNDSNTECEIVGNEQAFRNSKYVIKHNVAKDTIIDNDERISDNPDPHSNIVYRKLKDENLLKENEYLLLNNIAGMNKIQDMNALDKKLYKMMPDINDNNKKNSCNETITKKNFLDFNGPKIEKLQGFITHSDNENITVSDPSSIPVIVAGFNTVTNPFSNPIVNIKPKLTSSTSRFNGTNRKKSVVQHSQAVQVSKRKDGEVQTSEINLPTVLTKNEEKVSNKLKEEKPDVTLSIPLTKDEKVNKCNSCKGNEFLTMYTKNGSEGKHKEIIQETNDLIKKISKEENEPSKKNNKEEYNSYQHRICKKESTNSRQYKNKMNNEKAQSSQKNLIMKTDCREMPKNINSSYFQQDPYETPFKRLFNNDYKMTSRPTYFPGGMYTDNPMAMDNTYKWLTDPNRGFVESTSSSFRSIPKQNKDVQTAYPFFTKLKKILSKDRLVGKKDDKQAKKEDAAKEGTEIQEQEPAKAGKIEEEKKVIEDDKETGKGEETKSEQQTEVNLSLLWDYIIQGFNLCLGKTVHNVLIDSIYTFGTVTEKLQKIRK